VSLWPKAYARREVFHTAKRSLPNRSDSATAGHAQPPWTGRPGD